MNTKLLIAVPAVLAASVGIVMFASSNTPDATSPTTTVSEPAVPTVDGIPVVDLPADADTSAIVVEQNEVFEVKGNPDSLEENPERLATAAPKGKLPPDYAAPEGATVWEDSSVRNGYKSFMAHQMQVGWQDAVGEVRAVMEAEGWTCYLCSPFEAKPGEALENTRYLMMMTNGAHKVIISFTEASDGSTTYTMSFQG